MFTRASRCCFTQLHSYVHSRYGCGMRVNTPLVVLYDYFKNILALILPFQKSFRVRCALALVHTSSRIVGSPRAFVVLSSYRFGQWFFRSQRVDCRLQVSCWHDVLCTKLSITCSFADMLFVFASVSSVVCVGVTLRMG